MRKMTLDGRLLSVGKFVRQGAQFADIGTDHAYLPIYLLRRGIIEHAVAADINEGPLNSAKENAADMGVSDKIKFFLTDGVQGLENEGLTDIAIAGMGGELIADIIDAADFLKDGHLRLILQPMSKQAHLRRYLANNGFLITDEKYSSSSSKFYVTMCVHYSGTIRELDIYEAEFGSRDFLEEITPEARGYLLKKRNSLYKTAKGRLSGGEAEPEELALCTYLDEILSL